MRHAIVDDTRDSDDTRAVFTSIFYNRKAGFSKSYIQRKTLLCVLGEKTKRTGKEKKSDSSKKKKKKRKANSFGSNCCVFSSQTPELLVNLGDGGLYLS